jgi:hypothetical protein
VILSDGQYIYFKIRMPAADIQPESSMMLIIIY